MRVDGGIPSGDSILRLAEPGELRGEPRAVTPLRQFTILVAATLLAGGLVLGGALAWLLQRHLENETVKLTRQEVEVHFSDIFRPDIFTRPLNEAEATRFDPMVRAHFGVYDIVQLRLYDLSGRMIYNYLPGLRPAAGFAPELLPISAGHAGHVAQAAAGGQVVERTRLAADQNIRQRDLGDVLEVYVPIRQGDRVVGVAEVYRDISHQMAETRRMQFLAAGAVAAASLILFASLVGIFRDSTRRIRRQSQALARSVREVEATHGATLEALLAALETRDHETEGHSERVTRYARAIADRLRLEPDEVATLQQGALLHDIGKIGVPDGILRKPGPLDPEERAAMALHPDLGARMVRGISFLERATAVVRHHHERFDGRGYPDGLEGERIPLAARVFAVADTFDAMTSDRPYRRGLPLETALAEIERCAGSQFDPEVVAAFLAISQETLAEIRRHGLEHGGEAEGAAQPVAPALPVGA